MKPSKNIYIKKQEKQIPVSHSVILSYEFFLKKENSASRSVYSLWTNFHNTVENNFININTVSNKNT